MTYESINTCWVRAEPLKAIALGRRTGMATLQVAPWAEGPRAAELHPGAELVDPQGARNTNSESTLEQKIDHYVLSI